MTTTSAPLASRVTAPCISWAVATWCTDTLRATSGARAAGEAVINVTSAPRRAATSAMAWPCRPEELLVMTRTGSIGSRVPPAVTTTRRPDKTPAPSRTIESASAAMRSGSGRRPLPLSPPAKGPSSGSRTITPRRRKVARFSWTLGCSHISVCMAGHSNTGARLANNVAVSRSSASPIA